MVKVLIDGGADPNVKDSFCGCSALLFAATSGNTAIMRALIAHGANVNITDKYGETVLTSAIQSSQRAAARLLRDRGARE